jgi:dienelactone hydrolase
MSVSLYDTLKSSYGDKKAKDKLSQAGYRYDSMLSNHNQQVWYNPNEKKLLYNVAGTHNIRDVGTDAYLLAGKLKDTNRYKEADNILHQAKQKYNPANTTVTGHSLGSTIANQIASKGNGDKVYALDGGFPFGQELTNNKNFHNYRTAGDIVSILSQNKANVNNITTLRNKNWFKDPLTAHNVDNIRNEQIFV